MAFKNHEIKRFSFIIIPQLSNSSITHVAKFKKNLPIVCNLVLELNQKSNLKKKLYKPRVNHSLHFAQDTKGDASV